MSEVTHLEANETLTNRPFTHPCSTLRDLAAMEFTLTMLRQVLRQPSQVILDRRQQQIFWGQANGKEHRLIVNDAPQLLQCQHFVLVGFFGNRRRDAIAAAQPINETDNQLVAELSQHQGLLTYCTSCFPDETFGNTILFTDESAKLQWSTSQTHLFAVETISPNYYHHVRLHSGRLPDPLLVARPGILQVTKYYDFAQTPPWRAIRHFADVSINPAMHGLYEYNWQPALSE